MPNYSAGTASVEIGPDFRNFVRELRAELDRVTENYGVDIKPDTTAFGTDLQTELEKFDANFKVDIKPDLTEFGTELDTELQRFDANLKVDIKPDLTAFGTDLDTELARHDGKEIKVKVKPDTSGFGTELDTELTRVDGKDVKVKVKLDQASLDALETLIRAKLDALDLTVTVKVDADTSRAADEIEVLKRLVRDLTLNVNADTTAARADIARLNGTTVGVNVRANSSGRGGSGSGGLLDSKWLFGGASALSALPAAATALASVGADIQSLAQSAALLPAIFTGAALGVGTLVVGFKGMKDAFSDTPKKAQAAMDGLAGSAQQVVTTVKGFSTEWKDIAKTTQSNLFAGVSAPLGETLKAQLPVLKAGMGGLATELGNGFKTALSELGNTQSTGALSTIFGNTTVAAGKLNGAISPIIGSFRTLATTGSSFLPQLAQGLANLATKFDAFLTKSKDSGDLARSMQDGIRAVTQLASVLGNLGSSLSSVFRASKTGSDTFLGSMDQLTDKMSTWLKSTDGQTALRQFFIEGRDLIAQWEPILTNLGTIFKSLYQGSQAWSGILLPFLSAAAGLLGQHQALVTTVVTAYLAFRTLNPILTAVQGGISTFTTAMSTATTAGVGGFRAGLSGLSAVLGGGGLFGLALIGASAALGILAQKHQEAKAAADAQRAALEQLGSTLDAQTGKVTAETVATGAQQLEKGGYLERAQTLGVDPNKFTKASLGLAPLEKDAINSQLTQTILEQANTKSSDWRYATKAGLTDVEIAQALQGIPEAVEKYTKTKDSNSSLASLSYLKENLNDIGESAATLGGEMNNVDSSVAKMGESAQRTNAAINGTFELTQQGTQDFKDLGLAVQSVPDAKTVVVSSTSDEQDAKLKELGFTVTHMPDGTVKIELSDEAARAQIAQLAAPATKHVTVVFDDSGINVGARVPLHPGSGDNVTITGGNVGGRALGGPITGGVPGQDSVPILGMPGEHMLTVSDVDKLGGQGGAYRFRSALQAGLVKPFATGGAVGWTDDDETKLQSANTAVEQAKIAAEKKQNDPKASGPDKTQAQLSVTKAQEKAAALQAQKDNGGQKPKIFVPQAELPKAKPDTQISTENAQSAVDEANTKRNQVYADPNSTDADKLKADNTYLSAQNSLTSTKTKSTSSDSTGIGSYSLQSIFSKAGTILADGLLSGLGLQDSILSSSNVYNKAANSVVDHYTNADGTSTDTTNDYSYQPQNLAVDDTSTQDTTTATDSGETSTSGSGAEQWRPTFAAVLKALDMPAAWITKGLSQLGFESGGNAKAQNNSDSNAKKGIPSKGLMQVVDPTFATYHSGLFANDIWNPSANIGAALQYTVARYGSPENIWGQGKGYRDGGWVTGTGGPRSDSERARLSPKEFVVKASAASANASWLEAINSGATLTAPALAPGLGASTSNSRSVTHDHSVQFNAPMQVMDVDHLMREQDRWTSLQSQGAMAALP